MRKVIESTGKPTVHIDNVDVNKIYVSKTNLDIYKLQSSDHDYAFYSLTGSRNNACGYHKTIKEAVKAQLKYGGDVYELDNINELIEFLKGK